MEEWEYIEGHKDQYKDIMMEDHQPLTSADGSSQRNPPERCPSPGDSRDITQEPERCPSPGDSRDITQEPERCPSPGDSRDITQEPERCPSPGDSRDITQEPERCPSPGDSRDITQEPERCPSPGDSRDIKEEPEENVPLDHQEFKKFLLKTMILSINDPPGIREKDREQMAARILELTLEMISLITGEVRVSQDTALISRNNSGK
ncbi:uncharacterized protein [Engystomops pustulosus]|uniref:uncharacterized protein n=1 Tax=Engystomops pustulosus TaxID=76066 RepID=UPI003AFA5463